MTVSFIIQTGTHLRKKRVTANDYVGVTDTHGDWPGQTGTHGDPTMEPHPFKTSAGDAGHVDGV